MDNKGKKGIHRRQFLKLAPVGTALAGLAAVSAPGKALAKVASDEIGKAGIEEHDGFPIPVKGTYKPMPSYKAIFGPGFIESAGKALGVPFSVMDTMGPKLGWKKEHYAEDIQTFDSFIQKWNYHFDPEEPGHDQLCKALEAGSWGLLNNTCGPTGAGISDYGLMRWTQRQAKNPLDLVEHDWVRKEKYAFTSRESAAAAVKRAARLYGADLVGISRRDPRWDYAHFCNPLPPPARELFMQLPPMADLPQLGVQMAEMLKQWTPDKWFFGWDAFPFEPKTVIVLGFEMDYEAISASPTEVAAAGVGAGYSRMAKVSHQVKVFLKQLGYNAVSCTNDTGMSVPYAIAAGLGEAGRHGLLINYLYGPRVRLAKVYTNLDFVEYDKPKTFGVQEFCRSCMRCADSCPSKAISFDRDPSFEPTHEDKDSAYFNNPGAYKWYANCRKCFGFWEKNGVDCANCITSCPYNKPDYWHHRMVRKMGKIEIDELHAFLRQMDIAFGYGDTFDEEAVARFFDYRPDRKYNGGL